MSLCAVTSFSVNAICMCFVFFMLALRVALVRDCMYVLVCALSYTTTVRAVRLLCGLEVCNI